MDEPLSNLDAKLRVQMRAEIARLQRDLGVTTIYVTHDQVEAMTMGDRVAVLKDGYLQQVGTPQHLYDEPDQRVRRRVHRVAVDEPVRRRRDAERRQAACRSAPSGWRSRPRRLEKHPALQKYDGKRVVVGIRPEDFEDAAVVTDAPADRRLKATVRLVEALGSELMVHFVDRRQAGQLR